MASVTRDSKGARVWFKDAAGGRKSIRLGHVHEDYATKFATNVKDLNTAVRFNTGVRPDVAEWVSGLCEEMQDRLAALGLIEIDHAEPEPEKPKKPEIGAFVDAWIKGRSDVKPKTRITYGRSRSWLVGFFGEDRPIDAITEGDADEWAVYLRESLADNTARKMVSIAKQVFKHATRKRLIDSNPFADLASNVRQNTSRDYTITREDFDAVVAVVVDSEWRLIIALSRFGGLRVPSEIFGLKWADVDMNKGRFLIHSPKTEHHPDGASRVCPIFPELRPYFEEAFLAAADASGRVPGSRYVVTNNRTRCGNLSTQFRRFIERARLTPWPKLWHNMRATRQTELENQFPTHVVCKWLGNSPRVAAQHYLRVTEEHFALASGAPGGAPGGADQAGVVQDRKGQNETGTDSRNGFEQSKHRENHASLTKNGASTEWQKTPFSGPNRTRTCDLSDVNRTL